MSIGDLGRCRITSRRKQATLPTRVPTKSTACRPVDPGRTCRFRHAAQSAPADGSTNTASEHLSPVIPALEPDPQGDDTLKITHVRAGGDKFSRFHLVGAWRKRQLLFTPNSSCQERHSPNLSFSGLARGPISRRAQPLILVARVATPGAFCIDQPRGWMGPRVQPEDDKFGEWCAWFARKLSPPPARHEKLGPSSP